MSIFGELDINEIPDDPFYTPPNTYHCICTDAKFWQKEGAEHPSLVITWTIDDPDSDYHGNNIQEYFTLFLADVTSDGELRPNGIKYADLEANQKKVVVKLKVRLRNAFDLSEAEINSFTDPSMLISREAKVTTKENKKDSKYVNVVEAVSLRLWKEQQAEGDEASASMGLADKL